jgi:hypothetical protein
VPPKNMDLNFQSLKPYPTYQEENDNEFFFITDSGSQYVIYFLETDGYFPDLAYVDAVKLFGFDIVKKSDDSNQFDKRIADTIIISILEFLQKDRNILVYVCSQSDRRQRYRNRLFDQWYKEYNQNRFFKGDVTFDGDTFVSFITSRKNPYVGDFNHAFFTFGNDYK